MRARTRRHHLLVSAATLVGALSGYGRGAYGQQVCTGPNSNIVCSGPSSDTQDLTNRNDATVTTAAPPDPAFSVTTTAGGGVALTITGDGQISYTDENASTLTASGNGGVGLLVTASGDVASGNDGSVYVNTNGKITGGNRGIYARNRGSGDTTVIAKETVTTTGSLSRGIDVRNESAAMGNAGRNITVTTEKKVTGRARGIVAQNRGVGNTSITANGDVEGTSEIGVRAVNYATANDLTVTTEKTVTGGGYGIVARNDGSGDTAITTKGTVTGLGTGSRSTGIFGRNLLNANDLTIATEADSTVTGGVRGIYAQNYGSGDTSITANGNVEGTSNVGIYAYNYVTTKDLTVTTSADKTVTGGTYGINARNNGTGATDIKVYGKVYGGTGTGTYGIDVDNTNNGSTTLTVTTGASSTIKDAATGIRAVNFGTGALTVTANGTVQGTTTGIIADQRNGADDLIVDTGVGSEIIGLSTTSSGIRALSGSSFTGDMRITTNGMVTGAGDGIFARNEGSGDTIITVKSDVTGGTGAAIKTEGGATNLIVAGTVRGGAAGAVSFDQTKMYDDRLELQTGFEITTSSAAGATDTVKAGDGTDTLAFAGTGSDSFDLSKIDDGSMTKQFQGFETFTVESGAWSFSGDTTQAFTQTGGTLEGTGRFGDLTVLGGTVAPGNSIGTMTVNGAFTLGGGSTLEVEVDAAGNNDKVIVNGTVNLTGATLKVLAANGDYNLRTDYTIIDNDGSDAVKGTFAQVTSNLAFLMPLVDYQGGDGNDVVLTLVRNDRSFRDLAKTKNERAVGGALDQFPTDNPLVLAVLNQTEAGAPQAFNALSGEIHATVAGTLSDDSRYVREAVLGRLKQANHTGQALSAGGPQVASFDSQAMALGFDGKSLAEPAREPLAFWTRAYGAWGDFDSDGNAASADRDLGGFISGMDADIGQVLGGSWRAGLATGASFSNVDVNDRYSSADVSTYHLGGYIGGMAGAFALRGGGMWAWSDIETSRAVFFPSFYERQKANYDADTGQLFGEIAYPTQMGGITLEPFGGLAFVSVDTDSFTERGGPEASLRGVNLDQDVGYTSLGLRAATTMLWGQILVTPHISAAWLHAFDDVTPGASLAFASTGIGFAIDGVPLAEDSALLDAGLDFAMSDRLAAGVSYTGQFSDNVTDNGVKGRLTWLFN